ncbi:MAG: hypothetical protein ACOCVJ_01045 [Verrucomicrobiota bacterium]
MKATLLCLTALLAHLPLPAEEPPASAPEVEAEIQLGDSLDAILEALGEPAGLIELRDKTLLLYPRGEVTLKEDRVVEVDLMTEAEFTADQARLEREREEWLVQQEKLAAARLEEGRSIKAAKLESRAFASLPAKDRVDYWRSFQIRYPDIDVSEQIASALEGYETELKELHSQQRIAELESRVAVAEREAAAARLEAEKLREEAETVADRRYGLRYYTDPVIHRRHYYKPPTVIIHSNGNTTTTQPRNYYKFDDPYKFKERRSPQTESVAERVARTLQTVQGDD